jgi:RNA polymerase sigma-70 factor (ECF subfamily)
MMDDTALFVALSRGDRDAIERLYDRHASALFGLAMQLVPERDRAEDLLHDIFVDLARHAREPGAACPPVLRWLARRLVILARAVTAG